VVVPDRKPDTTDQLRQGIPRRPSHIDGAGGIDCGPTGGLADGEETAYALDRRGAQILRHARCALINGELGKYTRVVALRIIADPGRGGMNPQSTF
jgi:hypothetical protein